MTTSRGGDLDSICSLSSSENSPRGRGQPNERLLDLLTRPPERGGYGGRLNYAGFATLAASLGWNQEDMDDCWYDIVMGEPCAEAVDMTRVAECVCSYCLASPLPILERHTNAQLIAAEPATPSRPKHSSKEPSTTVLLSPPTPPPCVVEALAPIIPEVGKAERARAAAPSPPLASPPLASPPRRRIDANAFPRYAVKTVSSEQKKTRVQPRHQSHRGQGGPRAAHSPRRASPAPAAPRVSRHAGDTVFFRLYEEGMEQQRRRASVKPVEEATTECTFQPHITPHATKVPDTKSVQYNRPTLSYFAKLTGQETRQDAEGGAPETPRVTYHPAPGPSSSVPTGYVEGVARLRGYIASRYAHASFEKSLRGKPLTDVASLVEAPILRLPVTVGGVTDSVDVRLASPQTHTSLGRRRTASREHLSSRQRGEGRPTSSPSPSRARFHS
ncbi:hypothetical protein LSCM4_07697 [Leishmania orientalis]|uniref:Uncharacterized protein n=1 Tax=Leishmania orientalis TaxID=2249476 RepID=A0A836KRM5_9TRYP|nr:hypothetical protein LSCM4_07697 [Leishmania orientalis]